MASADVIGWIVTAVCLGGTVLNVKKVRWCFHLWALGNIAWMAIDVGNGLCGHFSTSCSLPSPCVERSSGANNLPNRKCNLPVFERKIGRLSVFLRIICR